MKKLETFIMSLAQKFENKIKPYPNLHGTLYQKHDANVLLLILVGSMLFSLLLTFAK